jgi:IS5 family transposase
MIGKNPSEPALFQMIDMESLVPEGHRLRKIDAALDLSFVREALGECYTPGWGRPSVDPELVLRMMILGVLYDLSDRQLCDEIGMHAGFRWFCRLNFHDPVPDHSTLSRLRNERWAGSDVFTRLFEEVLKSCVSSGIVSGRHVSVDGTQIRANASMQSMERDNTAQDDDDPPRDPPTPRVAKEPQPEGVWKGHGERYSNMTHTSRTDPDARLYCKGKGKSASLSYLVHDVIDTKSRVILRRRASIVTGLAERDVALELVAEHEMRRQVLGLDQAVEVLTGDSGYGASSFVAELVDRGITPHVPLRSSSEVEALPTWQRRTFNLAHYRKRRAVLREAEARNIVRAESKGYAYAVSRKLRIRSEHIFAEAKNQHGLGRARHRSIAKVERHSLLVATVQNLKRLSQALQRNALGAAETVLRHFAPLYQAIIRSMINSAAAWPDERSELTLELSVAYAAKTIQ